MNISVRKNWLDEFWVIELKSEGLAEGTATKHDRDTVKLIQVKIFLVF